jgi:hypothetical protein
MLWNAILFIRPTSAGTKEMSYDMQNKSRLDPQKVYTEKHHGYPFWLAKMCLLVKCISHVYNNVLQRFFVLHIFCLNFQSQQQISER